MGDEPPRLAIDREVSAQVVVIKQSNADEDERHELEHEQHMSHADDSLQRRFPQRPRQLSYRPASR